MMRLLPTKTIMGTVVKHSDGTLICQEEATKNRVGFSKRAASCGLSPQRAGLMLAVTAQSLHHSTIHGKEPPSSDGSLSENEALQQCHRMRNISNTSRQVAHLVTQAQYNTERHDPPQSMALVCPYLVIARARRGKG